MQSAKAANALIASLVERIGCTSTLEPEQPLSASGQPASTCAEHLIDKLCDGGNAYNFYGIDDLSGYVYDELDDDNTSLGCQA